jgi:hypothetical protein
MTAFVLVLAGVAARAGMSWTTASQALRILAVLALIGSVGG